MVDPQALRRTAWDLREAVLETILATVCIFMEAVDNSKKGRDQIPYTGLRGFYINTYRFEDGVYRMQEACARQVGPFTSSSY